VDAQEASQFPVADEVVLELHGDGVLDVPLSQRSLGPLSLTEKPFVVGRRHQQELHRRAVTKECLQFLSREHFSMSMEEGRLKLHALTANPIWRDRDGEKPLELTRGDVVPLAVGDRIALGTGGESKTTTPEEAIRKLCWHLRPAWGSSVTSRNSGAGAAPRAQEVRPCSPEGHRTPPSPGGVGPRVSNMTPWALPGGAKKSNAICSPVDDWGPLLPPASEAIFASAGRGHVREERPSEAFGPTPQLLLPDKEPNGIRASMPQFGGSVCGGGGCSDSGGRNAASGALRAPVPLLEGVHEDSSPVLRQCGGAACMEFTNGGDEFSKSGFQY